MTAQGIIDTVKDNLGNRATGRIGGRSIDTVCLEVLNYAVPHLVQEAQPDYYNRTAIIPLVQASREYDMPVLDTDGDTIRVKDLHSWRCYRVSGTEVKLDKLNYRQFVNRITDFEQETVGTPRWFSIWGKNNTIYIDYFPSEDMTLKLFVETYPNEIKSSELKTPLPLHDQWTIVVEAFVTQHCFLKLQQSEMYVIWRDLYLTQKASISRNESQKHSLEASPQGGVSDPVLDPFVGRWN